MADTEITFEHVKQRFDSFLETHEQLQAQLSGLREEREHQATVSRSISQTEARLLSILDSVEKAVEATHSAMDMLGSAMTATAHILESSELDAVRSDVAALGDRLGAEVTAVRDEAREIHERLMTEMGEIRQERDAARGELSQTREQVKKLELQIADVPERQRRKLGLG